MIAGDYTYKFVYELLYRACFDTPVYEFVYSHIHNMCT